eukprot:g43927.t1
MIPGMKGLPYEERLRSLGLYLLEFRRMRWDLIEINYRVQRGLDRVDVEKMFLLVGETKTKKHILIVMGQSFRIDMRRNFFSER